MARASADDKRELALYLGSRLFGMGGIQVQSVAIGWQVYTTTGDPMDLGWVGLAQFLPLLVLSLWAGSVADRFERRTIVVVCRVSYATGALALAVLSHAPAGWGMAPVWVVLVLLGATRAFAGPANAALLPGLVSTQRLPRAIALSSTTYQAAIVAGPALGGVVYALGGPVTAYATAAGLELLAGVCVWLVRASRPRERPAAAGVVQVIEGLGYIWRRRVLLGAITLDLFAVLLGGAVALMPIFARDVLDVGETGLGLLRSAPAAGAATMALVFAFRPLARRAGPAMLLAVATFGAATVVFALSRDFALSLGALVVLGAADMVSVVVRQSLLQLRTPDEMRGRVTAVSYVFIGASNELGEFESGLTAAWWGVVPAVVIGGLGTLVVTGLAALVFPALRREDRLVVDDEPERRD